MPTVGSLFSGLGGFDLAFERAGFRVAWSCESDQDARRVLARHWPAVPCYPDVRELRGADVEPVDVLVGGWPCQDLSVAGARAGLAGARSRLFFEIPRLVREMREATDGRCPRFVVGENVPGLLSSAGGADFGTVLSALGHVGALDIGWRVLDAQWFGVPQRRRRVFVVADFGGRRAAEVLALADGLRRRPAPRREAREDVAGTIGVGSKGSGPHGLDTAGAYVTGRDRAVGLTAARPKRSSGGGSPERADLTLIVCECADTQSVGANQTTGFVGDVVAVAEVASTLHTRMDAHTGQDDGGQNQVLAAIGLTNRGHATGEVGETLRAASHGALPMVATREVAAALTSNYGKQPDNSDTVLGPNLAIYPTLSAHEGGTLTQIPPIQQGARMRRLMPVECERLQGVPDGWTDELADTARYRCLGNAVAVPVVEWIAGRVADALEADHA